MNNALDLNIKGMVSRQKIYFWLFWVGVIITIAIGENYNSFSSEVNPKDVYWAETITILATAAVIPLSLKLFSIKTSKIEWTNKLLIKENCEKYEKWSTIRSILLFCICLLALIVHYYYASVGSMYCAIIICMSMFFCIPSRKKILVLLNANNVD